MDKKMRDLDDVENILKENTREDLIEKRQNRGRRTAMKKRQRQNLRRDGSILMIPLLVIVLIIVIKILDHGTGNGTVPETSPVAESQSVEAETTAAAVPETTEDPTIVREYYDDVLEKFFSDYFAARLAADTDTLYKMTGVSNQTSAQTALLASQLQTQAGYIEGYQDIHCYAVKGINENEKLVFVTYQVKFRRVDTLALGIMYCYIKVNDQNEFEIVENKTPEQMKFVNDYATNHEEVVSLINQTNSKLLEAISSDQRLAVIYDAFQTGRIYTEEHDVIDSEVSLISVETEAPVTTAASETGSGTEVAASGDSGSSGNGQSSGSGQSSGNAQSSGGTQSASGTQSSGGSSGNSESTTAASDATQSAQGTTAAGAQARGDVVEAAGDPTAAGGGETAAADAGNTAGNTAGGNETSSAGIVSGDVAGPQ